jgi:hypothetical protein
MAAPSSGRVKAYCRCAARKACRNCPVALGAGVAQGLEHGLRRRRCVAAGTITSRSLYSRRGEAAIEGERQGGALEGDEGDRAGGERLPPGGAVRRSGSGTSAGGFGENSQDLPLRHPARFPRTVGRGSPAATAERRGRRRGVSVPDGPSPCAAARPGTSGRAVDVPQCKGTEIRESPRHRRSRRRGGRFRNWSPGTGHSSRRGRCCGSSNRRVVPCNSTWSA